MGRKMYFLKKRTVFPEPFLIFSVLSGLFMLSMFYRVSNAVIAPNLIRDLGLDAETLGILGGAFFYSFALLQIPMGPMLDRIGPRIVMTSFLMIGTLGTILAASPLALFTSTIGWRMTFVIAGVVTSLFALGFNTEWYASYWRDLWKKLIIANPGPNGSLCMSTYS
jgi:sugar phosphate permease